MKNKYFLGLDEVSAEVNSNCDEGLKNKYIVSEDSNSIQIMTASLPNKRVLQCFTHFS